MDRGATVIDVGKIVRDTIAIYMVRPVSAVNLRPLVVGLEVATARLSERMKLVPIEIGGFNQGDLDSLLLGLYGGQAADSQQTTPDLATPFILMNMVSESKAAEQESLELFFADIKRPIADAFDWGKYALIGVAVVGGYLVYKDRFG